MTGIALYGRTYLDAEVEIPIAELAAGKGKVDVDVRVELGGFPCNAARAIAGRLRSADISVVTRIAPLDVPRLRAALPAGTAIYAIDSGSIDWPPVTVIINPAAECRLLRSGGAGDLHARDVERVPAAALHVFGRVDPSVVAHVRRAAPDAALAWCAGASCGVDVVDACDLACVNTAEARALLATDRGAPRELAIALVERAPAHAVRVVTGRGDAPTVAAVRGDAGVAYFESTPAAIAREDIRRLKGVGDAFAAHFVVEAVLDDAGRRRALPEIERALAVAQRAAAAFMVTPP